MKAGKAVGIVALVALIAVAGYFAFFRGGGGTANMPPEKIRNFLCVNPSCGKAFAEGELNLDDAGPHPTGGVMAPKCPACGQFSIFATRKCAKCSEAYVPTQAYLGFKGDLKCPKCGTVPPRRKR
jgi:predicted RNA-binding Zn-ribbon protein involved in translation (DUF1610 family)